MDKTKMFNGKKYTLYGIMSSSQAVSEEADLRANRHNVRKVKTTVDGHVRYAIYTSVALRQPVKCPECGSRSTEPSYGSRGYMQCNKCGAEF
jgi:hypothetical protein